MNGTLFQVIVLTLPLATVLVFQRLVSKALDLILGLLDFWTGSLAKFIIKRVNLHAIPLAIYEALAVIFICLITAYAIISHNHSRLQLLIIALTGFICANLVNEIRQTYPNSFSFLSWLYSTFARNPRAKYIASRVSVLLHELVQFLILCMIIITTLQLLGPTASYWPGFLIAPLYVIYWIYVSLLPKNDSYDYSQKMRRLLIYLLLVVWGVFYYSKTFDLSEFAAMDTTNIGMYFIGAAAAIFVALDRAFRVISEDYRSFLQDNSPTKEEK